METLIEVYCNDCNAFKYSYWSSLYDDGITRKFGEPGPCDSCRKP